ncbi:MAG TPA: glycosyltransferase family 2 protein [Vicinamibacterales bacterium]|jgi:glycosyltransferase involved in cell wall biosynthesis
MLSVVIPVYNNEASLPRLAAELENLAARIGDMEAVFVVDGATDGSLAWLERELPAWRVPAQLIDLSRNFGSFAAIAAGLRRAAGERIAVMAADLQEPPDLIVEFDRLLRSGSIDVALGIRTARADPWWSRWPSDIFWRLYRRFVVRDMPRGGVDVFACTSVVRDRLIELTEPNTNLVALVLWLGFRRAFVPYQRRPRLEGRSGWTTARKLRYAIDSVFSFTDLPIRALMLLGGAGTVVAIAAAIVVFVMWALGRIPVLGYTPLMLALMFFGGLTALGFGIVGEYVWLSLQNARRRPNYIERARTRYEAVARTADRKSS